MAAHPHATRTTLEPRTLVPRLMKVLRLQGNAAKALDAFAAAAASGLQEPSEPLAETPKISCLMVSRNRLELVARSLRSYLEQTYPNKELVIVRDPAAPSPELAAYLSSLARSDIELICPDGILSLSALRNLSLDRARGDVVCQWDDDDIMHPDRIRIQLDAMREDRASASFLQDDFHYFGRTGEMYWIRWSESAMRCLPGTVMIRRSMARPYSDNPLYSTRSEDTLFLTSLACRTTLVGGMPYLYVYTFHDNNTWDEVHRRGIVKLYSADVSSSEAAFRDELRKLGLEVSLRERPGVRAFQVEAGGLALSSPDA
jgi:glycosyltransferase involved in cell wall biosynthesis